MLTMKIPAEIQEYKSKLIFGLSARQFFSIAGAILVGVPIGVFGRGHISADILPWIVILAVMPFFAFGFFTFKGMRFEELVRAWCNMWFRPQIRVYAFYQENILTVLNKNTVNPVNPKEIYTGAFMFGEDGMFGDEQGNLAYPEKIADLLDKTIVEDTNE